jgi:parvulin-like peptidyl-prolyl isomerase
MKVGEVIRKPVRSNSAWLVVGLIQKRPFVMPSAEGMDKDLVTLAERKIINQKLQSLLPK